MAAVATHVTTEAADTGEAPGSDAEAGDFADTAEADDFADTAEADDDDGEPLVTREPPDTTVFVVRGVTRYHLRECILVNVVDEDDVDTMTLAEAAAAGCTPCRACHED